MKRFDNEFNEDLFMYKLVTDPVTLEIFSAEVFLALRDEFIGSICISDNNFIYVELSSSDKFAIQIYKL